MDKKISKYLIECSKKHQGFVFYQSHTWKDEVLIYGKMSNEKNNYIDICDIKGKTILDLGCATGSTCFWALENGASKVIGIDNGKEQIEIFNELAEIFDVKNKTQGYVGDLNNKIPLEILKEKIDTIFCFALTQYIGYRKIWHEALSAKVIYVMGGSDSGYNENNLSDEIYEAKLLAYLQNNSEDKRRLRPLFKLKRRDEPICDHKLKVTKSLSKYTSEIICEYCDQKYVIKPTEFYEKIPLAANEYISYKFLMLLKSKGVNINVATVSLLTKNESEKIFGINYPLSLIEHLGNHSRLTRAMFAEKNIEHEWNNAIIPDWLYWFDRWIGRLDGAADSNLLYNVTKKIIPIDFSMAYHWACGDVARIIKVDFLDVPFIEQIKKANSDKVREIIKLLTDKEIYDILFNENEILYPEFIERNTLISYYTGLILRRNLL